MKRHIDVEDCGNFAEVAIIFDEEGGSVVGFFAKRDFGADYRAKAEEFAKKIAREEGGLEITFTGT
jgi:hypothetical protein